MIQRYLNSATVKFIYNLLRRFWFLLVPTLLVTFLGGLLEGFGVAILIPFFSALSDTPYEPPNNLIAYFYEFIFHFQIQHSAIALLFLILVLFAGRSFMLWLASFLQNFLSYKLSILLRQRFLLSIYDASWLFLLKQRFGHLQYLMSRDIPQVIDFLSRGVNLLYSGLLLAVYVFFAFMLSPFMTSIALGSGLVFMFLLQFIVVAIRRYSKLIVALEKEFANYMYQLTTGIKMIKSSIPRFLVQRQGEKFANEFTDASFRFSAIYPLGTVFFQPLAVLIIFVTFFFSYQQPDFNFAAFAVLLYLIYRVTNQTQALQSVAQSLIHYLPHVSNFAGFDHELNMAKEEQLVSEPLTFAFKHNLRFSEVSFAYTDREPVFNKLSFTLRKGSTVGIVGPSGAGKTTIADLILRLLSPTLGEILLDGVEIDKFNLGEWRRRIAYISQDIFLLNDTVRENVRLYNGQISDQEIIRATESAYISDLVDKLPKGLDTLVGERGMTLSVGQRQRLVLARAFVHQPVILILDEATSALDNQSELMVHRAIDRLRSRTTILIIAHRLTTVMNVDHLLVLGEGRIVEEGVPKELLNNPNSSFYKMYHVNDKKE